MAEGRIWQVFNMQGTKRTWYAGSSVGFESVRSVLSYNNLLLKQSGNQATCENRKNLGKQVWRPILDCRLELNLAITPPGICHLLFTFFYIMFHIMQTCTTTTRTTTNGEHQNLFQEMTGSSGDKTQMEDLSIKQLELKPPLFGIDMDQDSIRQIMAI